MGVAFDDYEDSQQVEELEALFDILQTETPGSCENCGKTTRYYSPDIGFVCSENCWDTLVIRQAYA